MSNETALKRAGKIKLLFLVALLLTMAFLGGAVAERTAHFLQDVIAALPDVLDGTKAFLRERIIFKIRDAADQLKWAAAITFAIIVEPASQLIRGP